MLYNISKPQPNGTSPSWNGVHTKLLTLGTSGRTQKFILQCQLKIESHHSKCIESIKRGFYNIPQISGSLHLVLISPDAEIVPSPNSNSPHLCPPSATSHYGQNFLEVKLGATTTLLPLNCAYSIAGIPQSIANIQRIHRSSSVNKRGVNRQCM